MHIVFVCIRRSLRIVIPWGWLFRVNFFGHVQLVALPVLELVL